MLHLLILKCLNNAIILQYCLFSRFKAVQGSPLINGSCEIGHYATRNATTEGNNICLPCSNCSVTEGVVHPCTPTTNTACIDCNSLLLPAFSIYSTTSGYRKCQNCTNCTDIHKEELVECTGHGDSVCGECLPGYFLGVDVNWKTRCLRCSKCPPEADNERVIKWRECQQAGLSSDMWCSPGYDLSTTSSIPFSQDSVKTTEASSRISIGTNNFLLFPKQGLLDEGDTTSTQTAIIMITFIVLLTLIILSIFLCLSLGTIMKMRTRLQNYQVLVVGRSPDDDSCTARNSFTLNVQHDTTQQQ